MNWVSLVNNLLYTPGFGEVWLLGVGDPVKFLEIFNSSASDVRVARQAFIRAQVKQEHSSGYFHLLNIKYTDIVTSKNKGQRYHG